MTPKGLMIQLKKAKVGAVDVAMSIKCVLAYLSTQMQYSIPRRLRQEDLWDSLARQQL